MTYKQAVDHILGILYSRAYNGLTAAQKPTTDEAAMELLNLLATTQTEGESEATGIAADAANTASTNLSAYASAVATLQTTFPDPFATP